MALANGVGGNGTEVKPKDQLDLGGSITQGDRNQYGPGLYNLLLTPSLLGGYRDAELIPALPAWWSQARDNVLSSMREFEGFWDIALSISITKQTAQAFEVEGASDLMARKGQELFNDHTNGGQGWVSFSAPNTEDFLTTDKGCFIEIDRQDNSKPGSKVVGLYHLDSHRCFLTGDPDQPVIYWSLDGSYHYLAWWQVFHMSDQPSPRNNYVKIGHCAAGRAYQRIKRMAAALELDYQEMTGSKANTLELITNVPPNQIEDLFTTDKTTRGFQQGLIQGNVIMGVLLGKDKPEHITIKIRSKPQGWDFEMELEHTAIWYSDCLGLDKADLKPFTGRMAGTATQSIVAHNKQSGKGLIAYNNQFQWFMSNYVLPTQASFHWIDSDLSQKKENAELFNTWMTGLRAAVGTQGTILTGPQAVQKLVDENQLEREYLPNGEDITPGVALEDGEKLLYPVGDGPELQQGQDAQQTQGLPQATPAQTAPAPKTRQVIGQIKGAVRQALG